LRNVRERNGASVEACQDSFTLEGLCEETGWGNDSASRRGGRGPQSPGGSERRTNDPAGWDARGVFLSRPALEGFFFSFSSYPDTAILFRK
jgi:hypothetical protein